MFRSSVHISIACLVRSESQVNFLFERTLPCLKLQTLSFNVHEANIRILTYHREHLSSHVLKTDCFMCNNNDVLSNGIVNVTLRILARLHVYSCLHIKHRSVVCDSCVTARSHVDNQC